MFVLSYITQLYCLMIRYLKNARGRKGERNYTHLADLCDGTHITNNYITLQMCTALRAGKHRTHPGMYMAKGTTKRAQDED